MRPHPVSGHVGGRRSFIIATPSASSLLATSPTCRGLRPAIGRPGTGSVRRQLSASVPTRLVAEHRADRLTPFLVQPEPVGLMLRLTVPIRTLENLNRHLSAPPFPSLNGLVGVMPCICKEGWVCERHEDMPWPHDDCPGPGQLYDNPDCLVGRVLRAELDAKRAEALPAEFVDSITSIPQRPPCRQHGMPHSPLPRLPAS
jgi:hypothetical protein